MDLDQRLKEAADPTTSPERLAELAGDSSAWVRWRVAQNSETPAAALERLAADAYLAVRQAAEAETSRRTHPS